MASECAALRLKASDPRAVVVLLRRNVEVRRRHALADARAVVEPRRVRAFQHADVLEVHADGRPVLPWR